MTIACHEVVSPTSEMRLKYVQVRGFCESANSTGFHHTCLENDGLEPVNASDVLITRNHIWPIQRRHVQAKVIRLA